MVITNVSSAAISNLLQVCHDHQSDACSTGSNLSTFAASSPPKSKNNPHDAPGTIGTSRERNLVTADDHLYVREGEKVVGIKGLIHGKGKNVLEFLSQAFIIRALDKHECTILFVLGCDKEE